MVTLRPFYVYGPNSRNRSLIPSIIKQIKKTAKSSFLERKLR